MSDPEGKLLDGVRVLVLFGGSELLGQERANIEVFLQLASQGLKAKFITSSKWGHRKIQPELSRLGFEWTSARFGYHWGKFLLGLEFYYAFVNVYGFFATSWRVWREARRWRAMHIYAPNWMYWLYAAPAIAWLGLPLIFRAGDDLPWQTVFHRWTGKKLLQQASSVICNCEFLARKLLGKGLNSQKLMVIHNHPPSRGPIERESSLPSSEGLVVFYVGQISEQKGVRVLIEAAQRLLRAGKNLTVWLAGESHWDDFAAQSQKKVEASGFGERIQFLGYCSNVEALMHRSDVHVCPSLREEHSPNVVFEAKRAGLPSVVFPVGGVPELIDHGIDGYICRDCTAESLTEGIDYFLSNAEVRRRCGTAARLSLEKKFGVERFRAAWTNVFLAAARQPRETPNLHA